MENENCDKVGSTIHALQLRLLNGKYVYISKMQYFFFVLLRYSNEYEDRLVLQNYISYLKCYCCM